VNSINAVLSGYQVTTVTPALEVFPANPYTFTLQKGLTATVNVTFPTTTAGMQLIVGIIGTSSSGQKFQGADILVVNP
jgi:hypothetical protein